MWHTFWFQTYLHLIGLVLSCDFLNVTNANDESFNGEYGLSPLVANGAPDKDVYEKQDRSKVIFWKNWQIMLIVV